MAQSGPGKIYLFDDFCGPEIAIANAEASTTPGHSIGPFKITGDLVRTDSGVVSLAKSSGYVQISGAATADADSCVIGTEVIFSPVLNGPLVLETRLETEALTARNIFVGFCTANADDCLEPLTATTLTITKVVPSVGFLFDSQLTVATHWFMPYQLSTDTNILAATVDSGIVVVAGESDVLRVEIDPDGTARWYINGVLEQTRAGAATTTTLLAGIVGVFSTTTTKSTLDIDYLLVEANRDWTR